MAEQEDLDPELLEVMEPIHRAAYDGDLAALNALLEEDGTRLNARIHRYHSPLQGYTPLIVAAWRGHEPVVERLLALGADVRARDDRFGAQAAHCACRGNFASILALLLDAGVPTNVRSHGREHHTPLITAAYYGSTDCVALLIARSGGKLALDAIDGDWQTALHRAARRRAADAADIVRLLLEAGADPTTKDGPTPLDVVRTRACRVLLQAAMDEPDRPRLLLKVRTLLEAGVTVPKAHAAARAKDLPVHLHTRAVLAAAPPCLKPFVAEGRELPRVAVVDGQGDDEELVACIEYALGLAGGGGVVMEGQAPQVGMLPEVFVELCELLVPKWARKDM